MSANLIVAWVILGLVSTVVASFDLSVGEALACGVFSPIVVPVYLLLNLYRVSRRALREVSQ